MKRGSYVAAPCIFKELKFHPGMLCCHVIDKIPTVRENTFHKNYPRDNPLV